MTSPPLTFVCVYCLMWYQHGYHSCRAIEPISIEEFITHILFLNTTAKSSFTLVSPCVSIQEQNAIECDCLWVQLLFKNTVKFNPQ